MGCKIMFTKKLSHIRRTQGFLLSEMLVAVGVIALTLLVIAAISMFSTRSFYALFNYVDLDAMNKQAIDQITRDVRQANRVKSATATKLVLEDSDGQELIYEYHSASRIVTRTKSSDVSTNLTECDRLNFSLGQRNTIGGTYEVFPVATTPDTIKVVNVSWLCSRTLFGRKENTESVQTARIVIRKQGT